MHGALHGGGERSLEKKMVLGTRIVQAAVHHFRVTERDTPRQPPNLHDRHPVRY
jgi:hypothetical protein